MTVTNATIVDRDPFPDEVLAPTAALLGAQLAVRAALLDHAVAPSGFDEATCDLLVRLAKARGGSLRGVEIAAQLFTNPARVSRLVDRAEAAGLVERTPDPSDRRAQQVQLTENGWIAARSYAPAMLNVLRDATKGFSSQEKAMLILLLDRLAAGAAAVGTADG